VHLYKFFSVCRCIAPAAIVKFRMGSPKWLRMNKFVHTKSLIGSKFPKYLWGSCTWEELNCALILRFFSAVSDGTTAVSNSEPDFWSFFSSLRKDSVANYAPIWTLFSPTVTGLDVLCSALHISQFRQ